MLMELKDHKNRGIRWKDVGGIHGHDVIGTMIAELFFVTFGKLNGPEETLRSRIEIIRLRFVRVLKFRDRHVASDRRIFRQADPRHERATNEKQDRACYDGPCPHDISDCYTEA